MSDLTRSIGILGLVAACGPTAPHTDSSTSADGTDTGPTTDSDPTGTSTEPTTTTPPECIDSSDCAGTYCGYCDQGVCKQGGGCCGYYEGPRRHPDAQRWRCSPPYDCYDDEQCGYQEVCEYGECVPMRMPPRLIVESLRPVMIAVPRCVIWIQSPWRQIPGYVSK